MAGKKELNPFDSNDDVDRRPAPEADPSEPEISLESDDDGDDETDTEASPSRKEKKRNRYRENLEARERAEKEASEARTQAAQAMAQAQQAIAYAQQMAQGGGQRQQQQVDPIDQQLEQASRERQLLYREYKQREIEGRTKPITQAEQDEFEKRALDIENRQGELRVQRHMSRAGMGGQTHEHATAQAVRVQLAMKYPEISNSQNAIVVADGIYRQLIGQGRQPDLKTIEEAMDRTEQQFRFGKYKNGGSARQPDPSLRDKLSGPGRGANGGSGDSPRSIKMTKPLQKMADRAYSHIKDPAKRHQMWAKNVGSKLLADGVDLSDLK